MKIDLWLHTKMQAMPLEDLSQKGFTGDFYTIYIFLSKTVPPCYSKGQSRQVDHDLASHPSPTVHIQGVVFEHRRKFSHDVCQRWWW